MLYILVLTASLCCFQVKSYPYNMVESNPEYEEQLEGPKSTYNQEIDEIVKQMATCMNSTLTKSSFMDKLDTDDQLLLHNIGLSGLRYYVEHMVRYIKEKDGNEKAKGEEEEEEEGKEFDYSKEDDSEYSSEFEEDRC